MYRFMICCSFIDGPKWLYSNNGALFLDISWLKSQNKFRESDTQPGETQASKGEPSHIIHIEGLLMTLGLDSLRMIEDVYDYSCDLS